jgi:hypothetical protein
MYNRTVNTDDRQRPITKTTHFQIAMKDGSNILAKDNAKSFSFQEPKKEESVNSEQQRLLRRIKTAQTHLKLKNMQSRLRNENVIKKLFDIDHKHTG